MVENGHCIGECPLHVLPRSLDRRFRHDDLAEPRVFAMHLLDPFFHGVRKVLGDYVPQVVLLCLRCFEFLSFSTIADVDCVEFG